MITILRGEYGPCPDGKFVEVREAYITETADIAQLPACAFGSKALNITTGEVWILRADGKWQKFGTSEVYG